MPMTMELMLKLLRWSIDMEFVRLWCLRTNKQFKHASVHRRRHSERQRRGPIPKETQDEIGQQPGRTKHQGQN